MNDTIHRYISAVIEISRYDMTISQNPDDIVSGAPLFFTYSLQAYIYCKIKCPRSPDKIPVMNDDYGHLKSSGNEQTVPEARIYSLNQMRQA